MIYDIFPLNSYRGDGSTTTFEFDFYIENFKQLNVLYYNSMGAKTELTYNVDYSINEFKKQNGSYITFPISGSKYSVLTEDERIVLELTLPISQDIQYNNSSNLNLETLEYSFDYLTRLIQILSKRVDSCLELKDYTSENLSELVQDVINYASISQEAYDNICHYGFTPASNSNKGVVMIGDGINVDDEGIISVPEGANTLLNNLSAMGNSRLQYAPFAINNGMVQNGNNNTLTYSGSVITCDPCIITTADGRTKVIETATSIDVSNQSNGSYSIFKDYETGDLSLVNDFKISNVNPSSAYWLDTSTIPANLKVNSEINNDLVYIGDCTISSGAVTALTNRYFNDSGYLLSKYSKAVIMETYQSGTSWYRVYSDGWCEQGGCYSYSSLPADTDYQVSLLKSYKNTSYNIITTLRNNNGNAGFVNVDNSKGIAKTYFFMRIVHKSGQACSPLGVFWRTCGYIS